MESIERIAPKSKEKLSKGAFTVDCDIRLRARSFVVTAPRIAALVSAAIGGAIAISQYLRW
jgi:hypothetical protein